MTDDLDRLLREIARRDGPPPDHREALWSALQSRPEPRRTSRPPLWRRPVLAAALGALLACVMAWHTIGSEDFTLVVADPVIPGTTSFRHPGGWAIALGPDSSLSMVGKQLLAEELKQKVAAGEGELKSVEGLTIDGRTRLIGTFTIQTVVGGERQVREDISKPFPVMDQLAYMQTALRFKLKYRNEVRRMIADGSARYLGTAELMLEGRVVSCDRWRLDLPEFGIVIYWSGAPPPLICR